MTDLSDSKVAEVFGLSAEQVSSLKENDVWTTDGPGEPFDDLELDRDGNIITPISYWAELHGLTHQRANQLAELGIVERVRRGYCNFSESQSRYSAYLRDEKIRARSRGSVQRRDAKYYSMEGRTMQLREGGATSGELRGLCELTNRLLHEIAHLSAIACPATDLQYDLPTKVRALATTAGMLSVAIARSCDKAHEHALYIHQVRRAG